MSDPTTTPAVPANTIQHVNEQQFVATCEQCSTPARGAFAEFVEGGWVFKDGVQYGKDGFVAFCPGCVFGLTPVRS